VLFRSKDGTASAHGQRWFDLLQENGLPLHFDDEVEVIKKWEDPNPNSTDQVKDWLYSLGWQPCTFKYNKNKILIKSFKLRVLKRVGKTP